MLSMFQEIQETYAAKLKRKSACTKSWSDNIQFKAAGPESFLDIKTF